MMIIVCVLPPFLSISICLLLFGGCVCMNVCTYSHGHLVTQLCTSM